MRNFGLKGKARLGKSVITKKGEIEQNERKLCPECHRLSGVRNGGYTRKSGGTVVRYVCTCIDCEYTWKEDTGGDLVKLGVRCAEDTFVKIIALAAIRVSLDQIEVLLEIKADTIAEWLKAAVQHSDWERLTQTSQSAYSVRAWELDRLTRIASAVARGAETFHGLAARVRPTLSDMGRRWIQQCLDPGRFREFMEGLARGGHGQSPEQMEHHLAFAHRLKARCWPAEYCTVRPTVMKESLRRRDRAEGILHSGLIITLWGEIVRPDQEMRRVRWIKDILQIGPEAINLAKSAFTDLEADVFKEVCDPAAAKVYAMCEPLPDRNSRPVWQPVTLAHLIRAHFGDAALNGKWGERWISDYVNALRSLADWLTYCERASSQKIGKAATDVSSQNKGI